MSPLGPNRVLGQHSREVREREGVADSDRHIETVVGPDACPRLHRHQPGDSLWVSQEGPVRVYPTSSPPDDSSTSIHHPSTSPEEDTRWT